ncbi:MAG: metallophosphoesterase, partial [Alphaproteobacteria bacterium]|nr:metallophosphoesterase [Alphaproteobacteria bacterium]
MPPRAGAVIGRADKIGTSPAEQGQAAPVEKPTLLGRVSRLFKRAARDEVIVPTPAPITLSTNVRLAWQDQPFMLKLGNAELEFHPDLDINGDAPGGVREWIIYPSGVVAAGAPKFIRISAQETVVLGRHCDLQSQFFGYDRSVAQRHAKVANRKGDLKILPMDLDRSIQLSAIEPPTNRWATRRECLLHLPKVIGRPFAPFDDDEALDAIREVNKIVATEVYRDLDDEGNPGGVIRIPNKMPAVIMGDVHARVDNVLRVLTEDGVLAALEQSKLCLVFLGDLVHSEADGELEDMDSSILVMDLFCMLKQRFPKSVFYIHGNHESFSADIGKGGVPQALLFRRHLKKRRGKAYLAEVETLFDQLAYVIHGNRFAACHAAPVRSKVDRQTLVNIRRYPGLQYELTWNRLRQSNRPAGYGKGSVKRFRQTLDLPRHATLVVAHNPQSADGTLWLNVGDIEGHHIVYSARTNRIALMVMSGGEA